MAWVATAIVATGAISAYSSSQAAGEASEASQAATAAQSASAAAELEFAKEQQARWDEIFGPTQDVLAEYYKNLDPEDVAAKNVQQIQTGYQDYQKQLDVSLAQRGMTDGGLSAELTSQAMYGTEMQKAQARADAPQEVAEQQMNFLGLGMGIAPSLQAGVQTAYGAEQAAYSSQYSAASAQQAQADASFSSAISGIGTGLVYFLPTSSSGPTADLICQTLEKPFHKV